ncbi:MAG TPA: protein kinase [Nocardioides sp.]|nr:protein kinase [Nocardioides sp.]
MHGVQRGGGPAGATERTAPQGPAAAPRPVALTDRYEFGEVLGRGGMADVFRAHDRVLDREVAIKVLRSGPDQGTDQARFAAEARTLAQLSHSGLVMILDAGIDTGEHAFLVLELVDGPTLAQALEAGPLPAERAGAVGVQLAEALAYAHERHVVHRDVKPGNVLLGPEGRVKLADFGIARLIGDAVRHTRTGQAIGTAAYLAPEQVRGEPVTGAADIYSLGLVLLEALTGERAYPGPPTEAAVARLSRQPHVPPDLPGQWSDVLTAMTALDPARRPAASEVASRLRGEPTAPIPAATVASPPPLAAAGATRPLTAVTGAPPAPAPAPAADRAGDAIASAAQRYAGAARQRLRTAPPHVLGAAAALAAVVLLIVVVAVAAPRGGDRTDDLPPGTPADLEQPLSDLHDAVNGG